MFFFVFAVGEGGNTQKYFESDAARTKKKEKLLENKKEFSNQINRNPTFDWSKITFWRFMFHFSHATWAERHSSFLWWSTCSLLVAGWYSTPNFITFGVNWRPI